ANGVLDAAITQARTDKKGMLADMLQAVREGRWDGRTVRQVHTEADAKALVTAMGDLLAGKVAMGMGIKEASSEMAQTERLRSLALDSEGLVTAMSGQDELANRLGRQPDLPAVAPAHNGEKLDLSTLTAAQKAQMLERLAAQENALPEQQKIQQYIDKQTKSDSHTSEVQRAVNDRIAGVMNVSDYANLAAAQADLARLRDLVAKVDAQPGLRVVKPWGTAPVVVDPAGHVVNPDTGKPDPGTPKQVVEVPSKGPVIIDPKNPGEGLPSDVSKAEVDLALAEQSKANGVLDAAITQARTDKKGMLADMLQAVREGRWDGRTVRQVHTEADAKALVTAMGDLLAGKVAMGMGIKEASSEMAQTERLRSLALDSEGLVTAMSGQDELANRLGRQPDLPAVAPAHNGEKLDLSTLTAAQKAQMLERLAAQENALPEQQKIQQYIDKQTKSDSHTSEVQRAVNDRIAGVMNVSDYANLAAAQADLARLRDLVAKVDAQPGLRVVKPWGTAPVVVDPAGHVVNPDTGKPGDSVVVRVLPKDGRAGFDEVSVIVKDPTKLDPHELPPGVDVAAVQEALSTREQAKAIEQTHGGKHAGVTTRPVVRPPLVSNRSKSGLSTENYVRDVGHERAALYRQMMKRVFGDVDDAAAMDSVDSKQMIVNRAGRLTPVRGIHTVDGRAVYRRADGRLTEDVYGGLGIPGIVLVNQDGTVVNKYGEVIGVLQKSRK
ncbi:hypothetical protein DF039_37635, partial [Burkholderia cenocepacia]